MRVVPLDSGNSAMLVGSVPLYGKHLSSVRFPSERKEKVGHENCDNRTPLLLEERSRAMKSREFDVVTGAFGYTGKCITKRLLAMGRGVRSLTGHPERRMEFTSEIDVKPLQFECPAELVESLRGASTLYNTYWIRFPRGGVTFEKAVENTMTLVDAAREAGVERIVHISISNPSEDSELGYFKGKAE